MYAGLKLICCSISAIAQDCPIVISDIFGLIPRFLTFMRRAGGPGTRRHASDISPVTDLIYVVTAVIFFLGFPNVILLLVHVFQSLEVRCNNKAGSINKSISYQPSNALDLIVGMVTFHRIPGPPTSLVNVEKLGIGWGRYYAILSIPIEYYKTGSPI